MYTGKQMTEWVEKHKHVFVADTIVYRTLTKEEYKQFSNVYRPSDVCKCCVLYGISPKEIEASYELSILLCQLIFNQTAFVALRGLV